MDEQQSQLKKHGGYLVSTSRTPDESIRGIANYAGELKRDFTIIHCYEPQMTGTIAKFTIIAKMGEKQQNNEKTTVSKPI